MASPWSFLDRALADHLRSRRTALWAGLLAALALALAFVPLFDALGFEFAFVTSLAASFAAADLGAAFVRRVRGPDVHPVERMLPPGRLVAALFGRAALVALVLLLPPLVIISLNALRVRQCDWLVGGATYVLLPGLSVLLATTVGVGSGLVFGTRGRLAVAAAWIAVLGSIVVGVWRFYAAPPIFGYDPFVGYFPGSLYDEEISLGAAFFWSRLYQGVLALAFLAAVAAALDPVAVAVRRGALRPRERRLPILVALLAALVAAGLSWHAPRLGFRVAGADIEAALGGRRETEHFVIVYPAGAPFAHQIDAIAREHEFRYAQLARTLGAEPRGRITSYYFASAEEKQRWMGAARVFIAKPWRREIYLQHEAFPHDSLRHEIAHVFAGAFGDPLFGVSVRWLGWPPARFNVGFIEGLAVAADWPASDGRMTPHQAARAMLDSGRLPPLASLLTPGFLSFSSARSYTAAGSFVRYLLDRHGADKLRSAYQAGGAPPDLAAIYGVSLSELERGWHELLEATAVADEDRGVARERFRRPGIFTRPCPRAVARRSARAVELAGRGDLDGALAVLERICRDDPGEPSHRLALGRLLERAGRDEQALAVYRALEAEGDALSGPLRARVLTAQADLRARRSELDAARELVDRALELPVDEGTRRSLVVRQLGFADAASGAAALRAYVLSRAPDGGEPDPLVMLHHAERIARERSDGLGSYLVGRLLAAREAHAEAAEQLVRAQERGLLDAGFARENDRLLAASAFLAGDLATARRAAARLADPSQPLAVQLEGRDWLERCDFADQGTSWHSVASGGQMR